MSTAHRLFYLLPLVSLLLCASSLYATGWPLAPQNEVHPLGNNWGQFSDYGSVPPCDGPYYHAGIDVMDTAGAPVYSVSGGIVKAWLTTDGVRKYRIAVGDASGPEPCDGWLYAHIDPARFHVQEGDLVMPGELIGYLVPFWEGFHHLHFARIRGAGITWVDDQGEPDWIFVENPLNLITPNEDTEPPVIEDALPEENEVFAFCENETDMYLDPDNLHGDVDIIAKAYDRFGPEIPNHPTWEKCNVYQIEYQIWQNGNLIFDKLSAIFADGLAECGSTKIIYKQDNTCTSLGDYDDREFYYIVTNTDGDGILEETDTNYCWRTTEFPNGDYMVCVSVEDQYGNGISACMFPDVTVNNPGKFMEFSEFGTGYSHAVAWGDSDDDDDLDLAVANSFDQQNELYVNNGDGSFTRLERFGTGHSKGLAWGDFDNDGDIDLAVANHGQSGDPQNKLYVNEGNNNFTERNEFGTGNSMGIAWADYDNDGDIDLAVANYNDQQNKLYENRLYPGGGGFVEHSEFGMGYSFGIAWADYDNDGDIDLAVANYNDQQNKLYENLGGGTFAEHNAYGTGNSQAVAWGDYDNDGDLDLAVTNDEQPVRIYNNGGGTIDLGASGLVYRGVAWGDHDNDSDLDLAVTTGGLQPNKLFVNVGGDNFIEHDEFGTDDGTGMSWGDYDNDGDLDLAVANYWLSTQNRLYGNNQNDNKYIKVRLVGGGEPGFSNKDGIGAKVTVSDYPSGTLRGYREVNAGSDRCSMNALEAHFGVPSGGQYSIRVDWPSGRVTTYANYEAPLVITIYELFGKGDVNDDGVIDLGDVLYLINYLYKNGPAPVPLEAGDVNGDGVVDLGDVLYLINYLYKGGPPPCGG